MKSFYQLVRHEGNRDLFRAVEMSVVSLANGHPFHIHTEGLRGTGKTTILRSAVSILPPITRIKGCLYNCDPSEPHCPIHREMTSEQIAAIGTEEVPCPFLEISHGAKISTIVGSIDLTKLTDPAHPMAAILPGTIPQAHRGVIFVDEINRLADASPEIADVLLDVMGTKPGRIQIEESGLPTVEMPIKVSIWAASNPDEEPGALTQIRKQLSDRFDMAISMGRPNEIQSVIDILTNHSANPPVAVGNCLSAIGLNEISMSDNQRKLLASIYVDYGLESLRAVEAMESAAKLNSFLSGKSYVSALDIAQIVPLVLNHRADPATIANILKYLANVSDAVPTPPLASDTSGVRESLTPLVRQLNSAKTKNRLADWWDQVRDKLSRKSAAKNSSARNQSNPSASGSRCGSSPGSQIADPTNLNITAPPKPAVPLARLSLEEFVSTEEKVHQER